MLNRRNFLKVAGTTTAAGALGIKTFSLKTIPLEAPGPIAANDHIQLALIGAGIQGQGDTKTAVQVPGVKLVAVADCYNGRLDHSKELWGNDIFTTRDYKEILARKDVDAVLIGTPIFVGTLLDIATYGDYMTDNKWVGLVVPPALVLYGTVLPSLGRLFGKRDRQFILRHIQNTLAARLEPGET